MIIVTEKLLSVYIRWSSSSSGDYNRIGQPARLSPHPMECPAFCTHHTVHTQMETGELLLSCLPFCWKFIENIPIA